MKPAIDTLKRRLEGIKDDPNTSENEGQKCCRSLYLMVSFPTAVLPVLIFFIQVGDQERGKEA